MTATPLHSKKSDILNVVNVFRKEIQNFNNDNKTSESIMQYLMVRRLRVMADGVNKYHYRQENDIAVDLKSENNDYKDELFFALLQKKLIEKSEKVDFSKSRHLLDLLEGTTFNDVHNKENNNEGTSLDKVFKTVVEKFWDKYEVYPSNQKYNSVLVKIWESDEKALVFVRRRASAIELARQYTEEFDKKAWKLLTEEFDKRALKLLTEEFDKRALKLLSDVKRIPKRDSFDRVLGIKNIDKRVNEFINKKFILEYFDDYKEFIKLPKGTRDKTILENMANNFFDEFDELNRRNLDIFMKNLEDEKVEDSSLVKSKVLDFFKTKKHDNSTAASRFVRKFDDGRAYEKFFKTWLPQHIGYETHPDKPDKSGLIKSAILHASIGVVELFTCDMKTKNYDSFCEKVSKILLKSQLKKEIDSFVENFDKYEKYLKFNNNAGNNEKNHDYEENVKLYDTSIFHNAQPTYAYLSNTKNKSVISRFNSPFFPNMLCGTSTLQEGLNLHLQCNKVYHFGSAYSMGDDEQRTGRVDRIHGKMYRELKSDSSDRADDRRCSY